MTKTRRRAAPARHVKRAESEGLIEVPWGEVASRGPGSRFVVRLEGGASVEVAADFDADALRRLLAVLRRC